MNDLYIPATKQTPEVNFRFVQNLLSLKGESYPENASQFYGKIIEELNRYLRGGVSGPVRVEVALRYFNSASTKILFKLIEHLNQAAKAGKAVQVHWHFDPEDDMLREFGEDLKSDFGQLDLKLVAVKH